MDVSLSLNRAIKTINKCIEHLEKYIKVSPTLDTIVLALRGATIILEDSTELVATALDKSEPNPWLFTLDALHVDTSTPRRPKTVKAILDLLPDWLSHYCYAEACACSGCVNPWVTREEYEAYQVAYGVARPNDAQW